MAKYPTIVKSRRRAWAQVIPFYAYLLELRRIYSTTNAIQSLHMQLRKIIKTRGHFPTDEAATKLIWLALRNVMKNRSRGARELDQRDESVRALRGNLIASPARVAYFFGRALRPPPPETPLIQIEQETSTAANQRFFNLPLHTKIRSRPRT